MDFLPQEISDYAERHTSPESDVLTTLNRETYSKVLMPRMLSGHIQGQTLKMFAHMIRPKRVLEIGTYTGYSAICMAEGLADGGVLHTIDINAELEDMIRSFISKAGMNGKIEFHLADAMSRINELNETWDMVFIDADKENYSNYFDAVIDNVAPGGFIIADNVLWSGKVTKETEPNDAETAALKVYAEKVQADPRVENVLVPIRDGLLIARKLP